MASLSKNWVTEHLIDFEYKKYILLAYLQHVSSRFDEVRLYPSLGELVEHYQDLKSLQDSIRETSASFKTNLKGIQDSTLVYEPPPDDNISREIKSIIEFSLPLIEKTLKDGTTIYEFIEKSLRVFSVGIVPVEKLNGHILMRAGKNEVCAYEYEFLRIVSAGVPYVSLHTRRITSYDFGILCTYESIRKDLLSYTGKKPPYTYVLDTDLVVPIEDTLMPLGKRLLVKEISSFI